MQDAFINMLPAAMGVAVSPIPIVAVILMLMSKRAHSNGPAFLVGWMVALATVTGIVLWLAGADKLNLGGEKSNTRLVISLILGVVLLVMALKNWARRPKKGQKPVTPNWMRTIDRFTTVKSFAIAFVLAGINPKNLMLAVVGALAIVGADLAKDSQMLLAILFVIVGSLSVLLPVLYAVFAPKSAAGFLAPAKGWLIRNNAAIMAIILGLIGLKLTLSAAIGL